MKNIKIEEIESQLNSIFIERDRSFPIVKDQNTYKMSRLLEDYSDIIRSLKNKDIKVDIIKVNKAKSIKNNCVFICGEMKSGTTLLLELLDGHKKLAVLPGDSHCINWINGNLNIKQRIVRSTTSKYKNIIKDWDTYWLSRIVNPKGQKPFWIFGNKISVYVKYLEYIDYWLNYLPSSRKNEFVAVVLAYYCANPKNPSNTKYWIEKTPGNENHVESLLTHFPKAKFIHIIRNPLENITSLKRLYQFRNWYWDIKKMISNFRKLDKTIERNKRILGKSRYLVIHYEDLTGKPKSTMKEISNFLDIEFSKQLLIPSINGIKTKANSMYKDRQIIGVIRNNNSNKWKKHLSIREKAYIYYKLNNTAKRLNYEWEGDPLCKHINRIKNIFHLY